VLAEVICNGLIAGSVYALAALGYTLVYGVLGFVNFAHGEFMMVGAFVAYIAVTWIGLPLPAAVGLSFLATGVLGVLVERTAYRPLYRKSRLAPVISSLGVSMMLRAAFQLGFGPQERSLRDIDTVPTALALGGFSVPWYRIAVLVSSIAILAMLHVWITRSRLGKAIRAVAQSPDLAQASGVNHLLTISLVFLVASGVGGASGAMVALDRSLDPNMGVMLGFKGFTASVVGGIGSLRGAWVGGFLLGLCEHLFAAYVSTGYRDALTFVVLVIFLLAMPNGLFGKAFRKA